MALDRDRTSRIAYLRALLGPTGPAYAPAVHLSGPQGKTRTRRCSPAGRASGASCSAGESGRLICGGLWIVCPEKRRSKQFSGLCFEKRLKKKGRNPLVLEMPANRSFPALFPLVPRCSHYAFWRVHRPLRVYTRYSDSIPSIPIPAHRQGPFSSPSSSSSSSSSAPLRPSDVIRLDESTLLAMTAHELLQVAAAYSIGVAGCTDKDDLLERIMRSDRVITS